MTTIISDFQNKLKTNQVNDLLDLIEDNQCHDDTRQLLDRIKDRQSKYYWESRCYYCRNLTKLTDFTTLKFDLTSKEEVRYNMQELINSQIDFLVYSCQGYYRLVYPTNYQVKKLNGSTFWFQQVINWIKSLKLIIDQIDDQSFIFLEKDQKKAILINQLKTMKKLRSNKLKDRVNLIDKKLRISKYYLGHHPDIVNHNLIRFMLYYYPYHSLTKEWTTINGFYYNLVRENPLDLLNQLIEVRLANLQPDQEINRILTVDLGSIINLKQLLISRHRQTGIKSPKKFPFNLYRVNFGGQLNSEDEYYLHLSYIKYQNKSKKNYYLAPIIVTDFDQFQSLTFQHSAGFSYTLRE